MPHPARWSVALACAVAFAWSVALALVAAGATAAAEAIAPAQLAAAFPGADAVGPFSGTPPSAPVFKDGHTVGYLVSTLAAVGSTGYSGKPLDVLVGVDREAVVRGAVLLSHSEPILVIGVSDAQLARYVSAFAGLDLKATVTAGRVAGLPDAIAGATVSSAVIRDAILRAGRAVARSRGLVGAAGERQDGERLDRETVAAADWPALIADGSIASARFTDVREGREILLLELFTALLTPPRIGENLLGRLRYNALIGAADADDQLLLIAANGLASIKGTAFVRSGRFERLQIAQGDRTMPLTTEGYTNLEKLAVAGAPELREIGVFTVPAASGFDPLQPWRLDVLLPAAAERPARVLSLDYVLPDRYRLPAVGTDAPVAAAGEVPLWRQVWHERAGRVAGLTLLLGVLTAILVLQSWVVSRARLYRRLRLAFLAFTLAWLGWYAGGQLSVVNVLTFVHALMSEFAWEFFLIEPLLFILWAYTAVALLFLGRGVYCGWLCPFGALQELANELARRLRLPQVTVPFAVHERLWPIKYVTFLALFAVSLSSMTLAFVGAEIEPFKTAISLRFVREWPFVAYAVALIAVGLVINRFFCRYLCPLGAALAIPARLRMFEWLKRRPQCGRECQICFARCPVQAIHPEGQINPNECIHCLKCQAIYLDDRTCPPLAARRKRRERREALSAGREVVMEEP